LTIDDASPNFVTKVLESKKILTTSEIFVPPNRNVIPELWIMGSSLNTLQFAISAGFNCCLSLCHSDKSLKQIKEDIERFNELKDLAKKKNLKVGFLISFVVAKSNVNATDICQTSTLKNLKINFTGTTEEGLVFLKELILYFDPDLLAFANVYARKDLKNYNLQFIASLNRKPSI